MLSDLNCGQFTIINQIPKSQAITTKIRWIKHTLVNCDKKDGLYDKSSGQILYRANTFTAYVYDWQRYKKPLWDKDGYYALPDAEKKRILYRQCGGFDNICGDSRLRPNHNAGIQRYPGKV